ncbi:hypothetical protein MKW98_030780 [Papaver atlanticum]|uniref:Cytochrome P450 n=1 Tax=Papaver atlanticum TaxID=357466 RepID=A0AAD4S0C0_9MAGN|nr:hypothetical protein MKW98_030780 [Papaver atlanticum]
MIWLPVSPQWRNLRRITNSLIFTTPKLNSNQYLRQHKLYDLISHVHQNARSGTVVDISQVAFTAVLNLLSNTFFSVDLADYSSDSSSSFKAAVRGIVSELGKPSLSNSQIF